MAVGFSVNFYVAVGQFGLLNSSLDFHFMFRMVRLTSGLNLVLLQLAQLHVADSLFDVPSWLLVVGLPITIAQENFPWGEGVWSCQNSNTPS